MTYTFDNKDQTIANIKKSLTAIKKKEGTDSTNKILVEFINSTSFSVDDAISILDRYVDYCFELKHEQNDIITYLFSVLGKYDPKVIDDYIIKISNLYSKVKPEFGIQFIKQNLNEPIPKYVKIELLLIASKLHCEIKKYDEAFDILKFADNLVTDEDLSSACEYKAKIYHKMSDIAQIENKQDVYLKYLFYALSYENARELSFLPNIYPYFRAIDDLEDKSSYLYEEEYFLQSCENISGGVTVFINLLLNIYKVGLFSAFSIDKMYCDEKLLKALSPNEVIQFDTYIRSLKTENVLSKLSAILNDTYAEIKK